MDQIRLRALEPEDISTLFDVENQVELWKYSNRNAPFSKNMLKKYIEIQHQDIYESKQQRFVVTDNGNIALGFIDLFDFEPFHLRAGVGLVILKEYQRQGLANKALQILENHCTSFYKMHQLYANIAVENKKSVALFEKCGFKKAGHKKDWNFYEDAFHDEYIYQKILI